MIVETKGRDHRQDVSEVNGTRVLMNNRRYLDGSRKKKHKKVTHIFHRKRNDV